MYQRQLFIYLLLCCAASSGLTGCSTLKGYIAPTKKQEMKELVVPDLNSAQEQYMYASRYEGVIMGYVDPDYNKRAVQMDKVSQVHSRVIRNFPNDQEYTPLSKMTIADCDARMGRFNPAISAWQSCMNQYPGNELVQCRARFSMARAYESMGEFAKAKQLDREIIDLYGASSNARVRAYASQSQTAYLKTREEQVHPKTESKSMFGRMFPSS